MRGIVSVWVRTMSKGAFGKIIVWLVVILNTGFAAAVLYVFLRTGNEPTALIGCWFGFTTGELWLLSTIKKSKVKVKNEGIGGINEQD